MKAIIGVIPLYDETKDSLWMLPGYFDGIMEAGGIPVMLPLTSDREILQQTVNMCNGIMFTGGHDVSPEIYHESDLDPAVCSYCPERDSMEQQVLKMAMENDTAILGICRGLQFINAALGGTLFQDLPLQYPSDVIHHQKAPYDVPAHIVHISEHTPLYSVTGKKEISVNSCHHQAIKELSPELQEMAAAPDGVIEAAFHPKKHFLWAVQWHPEFSHKKDQISKKIFRAFVEASKETGDGSLSPALSPISLFQL